MKARTGYLHGSLRLAPRKGYEVWELRYRLPNGKQSDKILGKAWTKQSRPPQGFLTRQQAEAAAQRFLDEHADSVPDDRKTFGRAVQEYLQRCREVRDLSPNTMRPYEATCEHLCKRAWRSATWRERPLDTFESTDIKAVESELRDRHVHNHTLNWWRGIVRGIFGKHHPVVQCWEWSAIGKNVSRGKLQYYKPEQVAKLYEHAADLRDLVAYTLATEEGLRTNEFRGLKIHNLDFDDRIIHVEDGYTDEGGDRPTKSYAKRSLPMTDNAHQVLWQLVGGRAAYDDFGNPHFVLEEAPGIPISYHELRRRFMRAQRAAGLPRLTLHKLRHTFGTQMIRHPDVDIYKLQQLMGHNDMSTTAIYLHYQPDDNLRNVMSSIWSPQTNNVVPLRRAG